MTEADEAADAIIAEGLRAAFPDVALVTEEQSASHSETANTRSEEHTSELQSPVPISYAVFCLKKKKDKTKRGNSFISRGLC